MGVQKAIVAAPTQYPQTPRGYYSQAFKKDKRERADLKAVKKLHKQLIKDDYGKEFTPAQLKKIMNPRSIRLKD